MTDGEFDRVKAGGAIDDRKVTHPVLLEVFNETVHRNLDKAVQRREKLRVVNEKRREAKRLAAVQRYRQRKELKRAEEERRQAQLEVEREAVEQLRRMRDNPSLTPQLEDVANFPERYAWLQSLTPCA
jgi:hypothetical protein